MEDLNQSSTGSLSRLRDIVARLRAPEGCPWDREQTHASLRSALVEECYEVIEAIDRGDDANLREELGDLLLNVLMQTQIAEERAAFTFDEVAEEVSEKLVRRHPHVFGDSQAKDTEAVLRQWEEIKKSEKPERSSGALGVVSTSVPALLRAQTVQKKAARVNFDWPDVGPVFEKMQEELAEVLEAIQSGDKSAIEAEVGDILFTAVNLARKLRVDAESTLNAATNRFIRRFEAVDRELGDRQMADTPLEDLDKIWNRIKHL